jgi:integrase
MSEKANFTADRVAKYSCDASRRQAIYWDAKTPGLGLRVTAKGAKSFIFEKQLHGRTIRITIGDVRTWSIAKAQAKATELKALTDQGIDPRKLAVQQREDSDREHAEQKAKSALINDLWDEYIAYQKDKMGRSNIERGKKWGDRHLRDHEQMAQVGGMPKKRGTGLTVAGVLRPLLNMQLADMSTDTLRDWLRRESETRANKARQGFEAFRAFWRWCATRPAYKEIIDTNLVEEKELRDEVPGRRAKEGDSLEKEQLKVWFKAVKALSSPVLSVYLQALLLTGARREEMAALKWVDVEFRWNSLTLHDKVDASGERTIPLTPYFKSLLQQLKRINETPPPKHRILDGKSIEVNLDDWSPSPWVFASSTSADGKLSDPRRAHNRALDAAGLPHVSLHGLRRSFKTLSEWVEMPTGVVDQIQGHKPSATAEKHYKRRPIDLLRKWHTTYEEWIMRQAGVKYAYEESSSIMAINSDS